MQAERVGASLLAREQSRRRAILVAIGLLMLLGTSPVFGHHIASPLSTVLSGRDHLLSLCLIAVHELLAPLHLGFHVVLIVGLLYAGFDRVRAIVQSRVTLRLFRTAERHHDAAIARAIADVGIAPNRVRVIRGLPAPAFTAGLFNPAIYVSADLSRILKRDQLAAVLAHEEAHRRRRDPLRLSVFRFFSCALFYLPAIRRLADDMADESEIRADDSALAHARVDALTLASALVALAGFNRPTLIPTAVGFHRIELLERRVKRLVGEAAPVSTHVTRRSIVVAASALCALWVSGIIMAHPLGPSNAIVAAPTDPAHCAHHRGVLSHLFCRDAGRTVGKLNAPASGPACPHSA